MQEKSMDIKERKKLNPRVMELKKKSIQRSVEAFQRALDNGTVRAVPSPVEGKYDTVVRVK